MRVYHGSDVEIVEIDLSKSLMNKANEVFIGC